MATQKAVGRVVVAVLENGTKRATKYLSPKLTVKATLQGKPSKRARQRTVVVTVGEPNYQEREFIKLAKRSGEPFPIRKIQLKPVK